MGDKIQHRATFQNGTELTRTSKRVYPYAWAIFNEEGKLEGSGFSADALKAQKAAEAQISNLTGQANLNSALRRGQTLDQTKYRKEQIRKHGGKEAWQDEINKKRACLRAEVVETKTK